MKRRNDAPRLSPSDPHSVIYLAARREWNERYGSYIARERIWRWMAFACLGVTAVAVYGYATERNKNHAVPFVVEVDRLGATAAMRRAEEAAPLDPKLIKYQLARWVSDMRSVRTDRTAQHNLMDEAFAWIDRKSPAAAKAVEWGQAHNPFDRMNTELVDILPATPLPVSGNTWRVPWREITRGTDGRVATTADLEAMITFSVTPPADDATIAVNPTGLYVTDFTFPQ